MFVFEYRHSGRFLSATDKRVKPYKQSIGTRRILMYDDLSDATFEFWKRQCNPDDFEIVELEPFQVKARYTHRGRRKEA